MKEARVLLVAATAALAFASGRGAASRPAHAPDLMDRARALVISVIHGDLPVARQTARWVAEHAEPVAQLDSSQPSLAQVKAAATAAAEATDTAGAADAAAQLFASCGGCHEAVRVVPAFPRVAPPPLGSIAGHMVRHQHSADLLLEGLVVPSQTEWARGSAQLGESPLKPGDFPVSDRIAALMAEVEIRLHAQAVEAGKARDTPGRARAFGVMLATCAECHTKHTTLWPQGGPR